jgi:GT2 family glycosyltransferase
MDRRAAEGCLPASSQMTLTLPAVENPEQSVVMVTHGAWPLIERAVGSLIEHTRLPFELILVDNGSDPDTRVQLERIENARLVANEENRGFGPASNQGAEQARGEHLVLLNSDAFVSNGWLDLLLDPLADPSVGATVPQVLNPDGSLQEAGALLARDGTAILYGDGDDPELGCYRFARTVDYGSAVCMAMRRSTFTELGGFDDAFAPAYYEDTDFCMRLATRRMSVRYEPRARVTHVRYGSGGVEAALELSERNRRLFAERWAGQLGGRPPTFIDATVQSVIASRDAWARPRFLVCSAAEPAHAEPVVDALRSGWPAARVTWCVDSSAVGRFDPREWLARGVEVLDGADGSWLSARLFHYDAVFLRRDSEDALRAELGRTQPQAPLIPLDERSERESTSRSWLARTLPRAGIPPPL